MKTIFRSLSMAAIVAGLAVTGAFAQDVCDDLDGATAKYEAFTANYQKNKIEDLGAIKGGLTAGKEFLEKWGACEAWTDQAKFVRGHVPRLEKMVKEMEDYIAVKPITDVFDPAIKADNYDQIYSAGKQLVAKQPENLSAKFVMAVVGVGETGKALQAKTTSKHASAALAYAKSVYDHIKGGGKLDRQTKDGKEYIGYFQWERSREEALSQLAYAIGYLNYYALNNKKAGVANYYEVTQLPGYFKTYSPVYATLSDYYIGEAEGIGKEIVTLTNEYNALVDAVKKIDPNAEGAVEKVKQLDTDIKAKEAQIKAKEALFNGYTERAMDALARAHKVARDGTPAEKQYKQGLFADLQRLYERRFPNKQPALNDWVATATAKPLPDPTSTVQPVTDEATTTTTTTTSATPAGNGNGTVAKKP